MKVEKNVPMPERSPSGHHDIGWGNKKYPFEKMEVGDSFFVEAVGSDTYGRAFRAAVSHRNNRNNRDGKRFQVRPSDGGYRCWRVE